MAVTLKEISEWLNEEGANHQVIEDKQKIVFGITNGDTRKGIIVDCDDEKVFSMIMNLLDDEANIVQFSESEHIALVLSHILHLNYKTKFGTWEYDPNDGEIRCAIEIPLEDATMTQNQFKRIFGYFQEDAQNGFDEVLHIVKTGELPNNDSAEAALIALLQMLKELDQDKSNDEDGI